MRVFAKNNSIFKLFSDSVSEGLLMVNTERTNVATNRKADKMFGFCQGELMGQPLHMLIPDPYKKGNDKHVDDYFKTHKTRKTAVDRCLFRERKHKEQFSLDMNLGPFAIYEIDYELALVFDQVELPTVRLLMHN